MSISAPYYPIIYVRGYAATMNEIEETVATPYMGFNLGAAKIRQDHEGKIVPFIFESPLLRLIKDEGYIDTYKEGKLLPPSERIPVKSVWIFRYYEQASEDLGTGKRQTIPNIARDLRRFILRIRSNICGSDRASKKNFRVYLVAHSMGGLICRCYIQNLCAHGTGNGNLDKELELPSKFSGHKGPIPDSVHLVDKIFTYATPHNGIEFLGMNVPDIGRLDPFHTRNFNREVIHDYLKLKGKYTDGKRVDSLENKFPTNRFFCFVGSNYDDYTAFFNASRKATGPMSDGLVMIKNATVEGAPRAFAYRSHSGHYGIVNSEEGFQNLRRFLFGQVKVDAKLLSEEITLPAPVQKEKDEGKKIRASYHIDTTAQVRGAMYFLHERKVDQASAIFREYEQLIQKPVYLFTGFLIKKAKVSTSDTALAFAVKLRILVPLYEVDNSFWFDEHYEGGTIFDDTITFHVRFRSGDFSIHYGLASKDNLGEAPHRIQMKNDLIEIPLGFDQGVDPLPRPGFRGKLELTVNPWNG